MYIYIIKSMNYIMMIDYFQIKCRQTQLNYVITYHYNNTNRIPLNIF